MTQIRNLGDEHADPVSGGRDANGLSDVGVAAQGMHLDRCEGYKSQNETCYFHRSPLRGWAGKRDRVSPSPIIIATVVRRSWADSS